MGETKTLTDGQLEEAFESFACALKTQRKRKQRELQAKRLTSPLLAWELCIEQFAGAFVNKKSDDDTVDTLCWYLTEYLASWGMTRNSKLTREAYRLHEPVVRAIMEFSDLRGKDLADFCDEKNGAVLLGRLETLYERVKDHCAQFSRAKNPKASDVRVSKIILGTLGIMPAYDTHVRSVLKECGIATRDFSMESFRQFACYFTTHHTETIGRMTEEMQAICPFYTRAKIIDGILWYVGN